MLPARRSGQRYGRIVSQLPHSDDPLEWQPGTSKPGEIFTVEGQIKSYGAMTRNFMKKDPRYVAHRRQMMKTGLTILVAGVVLCGVLIAIL